MYEHLRLAVLAKPQQTVCDDDRPRGRRWLGSPNNIYLLATVHQRLLPFLMKAGTRTDGLRRWTRSLPTVQMIKRRSELETREQTGLREAARRLRRCTPAVGLQLLSIAIGIITVR